VDLLAKKNNNLSLVHKSSPRASDLEALRQLLVEKDKRIHALEQKLMEKDKTIQRIETELNRAKQNKDSGVFTYQGLGDVGSAGNSSSEDEM